MVNRYGTIIGADDVAAAVEAHLKLWEDTYRSEVAHQSDGDLTTDDVARFHWQVMADFTELDVTKSPTCVVVPAGLDGIARRRDGILKGRFTVEVYVYVAGPSHRDVVTLVGRYTKMIRTLLLQQPRVDGLDVEVLQITAEGYDALTGVSAPFVGGGVVVAQLTVLGVGNRYGGPPDPPADVDAPYPFPVDAIDVQVTVEPMEG